MIEYFETLITQFSAERKCGFCWQFFYTGRKDYTNLIQPGCECAILVFETLRTSRTTNPNNGEETKSVTIDGFIGFSSHLSESFYNESENDCKAISKYVKYLKPIRECFDNYFPASVCIDGIWYRRTSETTDQVLNYLDANLDGYKLRVIYSA